MSHPKRALLAALLLATQSACTDATGGERFPWGPSTVYVATAEEPFALWRVDPANGRAARAVTLPGAVEQVVSSPDRATLYVVAANELLALDARTLRPRWRERLSTPADPRADRWGGVRVAGYTSLAVSADGRRLYLAPAFDGDPLAAGTGRIAVLDADTRDLQAALGPFMPGWRGVTVAADGDGAERLLVAGGREQVRSGFEAHFLFAVDPASGAVRDSTLVVATDTAGNRVVAPAPSSQRGVVYAHAGRGLTGGLHRWDLATGRSTPASSLQFGPHYAVSPSRDAVYQLGYEPASRVTSLVAYDAMLAERGRVAIVLEGRPLPVQGMALARDGRTAFVAAGASSFQLHSGDQASQSSLVVVDLERLRVRRVVRLPFVFARLVVVP